MLNCCSCQLKCGNEDGVAAREAARGESPRTRPSSGVVESKGLAVKGFLKECNAFPEGNT